MLIYKVVCIVGVLLPTMMDDELIHKAVDKSLIIVA